MWIDDMKKFLMMAVFPDVVSQILINIVFFIDNNNVIYKIHYP